jgi:hypothetical protein
MKINYNAFFLYFFCAKKFPISHGGHLRLRLCKLKSPSDVATQDCFEQQRIKIKPVSWSKIHQDNNAYSFHLGKLCPKWTITLWQFLWDILLGHLISRTA